MLLLAFVGRVAGRTPLPMATPTQRQSLDLDSGSEDLDQSCLGLGGGQRRGQRLRWPGRGSPMEAEVKMRVLERFGGSS